MVQHAAHHLSFEQIRFLNRGPTYVIPCQMHVLCSNEMQPEILIPFYLPLRKQLFEIFTKFSLDQARQQAFRHLIEQQFAKSFSQPMPIAIRQRALRQKQLLRSIQFQLKHEKLLLRRTADDFNTFFLCHRNEFNRMAQHRIEDMSCFEIIGSIDFTTTTTASSSSSSSLNSEQQHLARITQSMDAFLQELTNDKLLPMDYFKKLQLAKKTNVTLPYLYFLPVTHQNGYVQLQPRLSSCKNAPVRVMATFLDRLLRPLFNHSCRATMFLDGHDFIQKLQQYCLQANCLTLNTKFVTFELHNLYIRISHADLLLALNRFLVHQLSTDRHQRLTIKTIEILTKFVLEHHIFTYKGQLYRYTKGSPVNFAFTQLLFDIFIYHWQIILVRYIRVNNQFYGRYHNQGIFTWYDSDNELLAMCINELNEQNPDVQLTISSGHRVHFLQASIENQKGVLHTSVYEDAHVQPFLLPYSAEHPRLLHRQWFRFRLARAIQYCQSFDDFQEQRLQLELTFLANGYSLEFVHYLLNQFYQRFNSSDYPSLRLQVFRYYNENKFNINCEQSQQDKSLTLPPMISVFYLFDWGHRIEFNRKFLEFWFTIVMADPNFAKIGFKIILRSKQCYLSDTLLVQYKSIK